VKSRLAPACLIAALGLAVAGCSMSPSKLWPFHKKQKPAPEVVHEVDLANPDGSAANYPQYWKRNTLVIDLTGVSGAGGVAARLPAETTWPVRIALRVRPGSVEQLEVVGEERSVISVTREGVEPVDFELSPSLFRANTGALYINWGAMPQFAAAPAAAQPEFVSPTEVPKVNPDPAPPSNQSATPDQPSPPPGS
jgi:hypothetical protein